MRCTFLFLFLISAAVVHADPGTGIVADSKGTIFYTDLSQVWMIKPDGTKSVAVPNVHTHELYINNQNELFGEHLWYNGEQSNTWGHYLWKRNSDGSIVKIKDSTAGFPEWVSFVRDVQGNAYYHQRSIPSAFWKLLPNGTKELIGKASLNGIGRLYINKKSVVFFSNKDDLYCIPPGDSLQIYLKNIGKEGLIEMKDSDVHAIMSIWGDQKDNLYIASGSVIKQIDKKKFVTIVYKSAEGWKPSGGLVTANGDFWVLEYNTKNEVRVNKISKDDRKQIAKEHLFAVYIMPVLLVIGVLLGLYFLFRKKK